MEGKGQAREVLQLFVKTKTNTKTNKNIKANTNITLQQIEGGEGGPAEVVWLVVVAVRVRRVLGPCLACAQV